MKNISRTGILLLILSLWPMLMGLTILGGYGYLKLTGGTLTGPLTALAKICTTACNAGGSAGDITASRLLAPPTGALYFGDNVNAYLIFDGLGWTLGGISGAGLAVAGPLTSTMPAATYFTRVGPNLQIKSVASATPVSISTSCTTIPLTTNFGVPATAKAIILAEKSSLVSGTVAGDEFVLANYYSDAGCSTLLGGDGGFTPVYNQSWILDTTAGHQYQVLVKDKLLLTGGLTTIYGQRVQTINTGGTTAVFALDVAAFMD
jgi:hypothetical protein